MILRNARFAMLILCAAGAIGCGSGEAPRYPVTGTILLNGEPYPDVTVQFVADPGNEALAEAEDVTGSNGEFRLTSMGRPGLPVGKYRVIVTPKPTAEEAADAAKYEDEIQREMALQSLGIDPTKSKKGKKAERPGGDFEAEVVAGENALEFNVKTK